MNQPDQREQAIVAAALKLPPKERAAYLDQACGQDAELRQRIIQALGAALGSTVPMPEAGMASGADTSRDVQPPIPEAGEKAGDAIGRYRLLEKLGEGGMGSVWVAEQRELVRRKVALKVIKLGMDTKQVIARFEAERQALALMDHPHIAKVLDAGATDNGRPFFVMELVSGVRITDYCDRHNLPTRERLVLFIHVCHALAHAHQKGIIHRDIKPANILVALQDGAPAPKVIDFGIAKAVAGQRLTDKTIYTAFEEFIGTPAYMSPEQAEMNPLGIDARSDIYALGVLLYELLTGLTPFAAERLQRLGPDEIRRIIREEEPPRPSTRLTTLDAARRAALARHRQCEPPRLLHLVRGDLDWIVMKCLEKDRTRRFESAEHLAADLRRHLNHEPVLARPPSRLHRLGKLVRRRRSVFAAAALTLVGTCVVAGVVGFLWPGWLLRRPPNPEQQLARATQWLKDHDKEGHIPRAMSDLKEALKTDPANGRLWAKLAWANWLLFGEEERDDLRWEASRCASNALSLNPKHAEGYVVRGLVARNTHDWQTATNDLLTAKQLTRSADGVVLISLAAAFQSAGDGPQASAAAQLAEQAAGNSWDVCDRLGTFYYKAEPRDRDLNRARASLERAVQLAPDSPLAHRHLGEILILQRAAEGALKEFERSLALRRTPQTLSSIGSAYLATRRFTQAADYFLQASQADPSKYQYHVNAGLALRELPARQAEATAHFSQALRQTRDALKAGGEHALTRAFQGLCHAALGEPTEARRDLDQAQKEAGRDMHVLRIVYNGFRILGDAGRAQAIERLMRE